MFTGLIEEIGRVVILRANGPAKQLQIAAPNVAQKIQIGDNVAVNGCCLTVASARDGELAFDLLEETFERTNLKTLRPGTLVNLEPALAADGRLGGHVRDNQAAESVEKSCGRPRAVEPVVRQSAIW